MELINPFQAIMLAILIIVFIAFSIVMVIKKEAILSLKFIWIILFFLLPVVGSFIYYIKVLVDISKTHSNAQKAC